MTRLITRTDDAVALIDGSNGRRLTYAELDEAVRSEEHTSELQSH